MSSAAVAEDPPDHVPAEPSAQVSAHRFALVAALGFVVACVLALALAWAGVWGRPTGALDVGIYRDWGRSIVDGEIPYADFPMEYPPIGLATFIVPLVLLGDDATRAEYRTVFEALMVLAGAALAYVVIRSIDALGGGRRELWFAAVFLVALPLLGGPLLLSRFDLLPTLITALVVWAIAAGRLEGAAIAIGIGILTKVYPIVLAPWVAFHVWRRDGLQQAARWVAILGLVVLAGLGPFYSIAPAPTLGMVLRQMIRPLQVEATGGVLLMLYDGLTDAAVQVDHRFDSYNLSGPVADLLANVHTVASVGALGLVAILLLRGPATRARLLLAFGAALAAYVAFGKVFSPQYVFWLVPLVAIVPALGFGRGPVLLLAVVIALTSLYYPQFYAPFVFERDPLWGAVILARNLALTALAGWLMLLLRRPGPTPVPAPAASMPVQAAIPGPALR